MTQYQSSVQKKRKWQDYYINVVASAMKFDSMMDGKDIRCKIGRIFPQYDVANFPGFDFFKAVENIFMQPYVKEWDYKTKKTFMDRVQSLSGHGTV